MGLDSGYSAGYSYEYFGGNATYCIIPKIVIDLGCVLKMNSNYFANASLSEPMSCVIGTYHAMYHTSPYVYEHFMGIKQNGNLGLFGGCGPMGIAAIDYAVHISDAKNIIVTDIDEDRINRVRSLITVDNAKKHGKNLLYVNSNKESINNILNDNNIKGLDDVIVFAANDKLIEIADELLGNDGCLNFFAGPVDKNFKAEFNFYNVHYEGTHIVGTSGESTDDMLESLKL